MKRYSIAVLMVMLSVGFCEISWCEEEHNVFIEEGEEHAHPHSEAKGAIFSKGSEHLKYTLSVYPQNPVVDEEAELELEIIDTSEASEFSEGYPINDAEVSVLIAHQDMKREEYEHLHKEEEAGVYGLHYTFLHEGVYTLFFQWEAEDGSTGAVNFDISVIKEESHEH